MATITVESRAGHRFATTIHTTDHTFTADEPVAQGGDDLGPSPYELLLAALGSCTAMTLELYARRKGWPLEEVTIRLVFDRVHEPDCEACEQPTSRIDRITREITLSGPLDASQRQRLLEIAAKCPVHRTMMGTPSIVDVLVN